MISLWTSYFTPIVSHPEVGCHDIGPAIHMEERSQGKKIDRCCRCATSSSLKTIQPNPANVTPRLLASLPAWDPPITTVGRPLPKASRNYCVGAPGILSTTHIHIRDSPRLFRLDAMTNTGPIMPQALESKQLTSGWSFKQTDAEEWLPVSRVPTNVHLDLLQHERYNTNNK
jgi:hypothetical protein